MLLLVSAVLIVLGPVAFSLAIARMLRFEHSTWVFASAAGILPSIPLVGGLACLAYFSATVSTQPPNMPNGGDGPAFFGIVLITFGLPCVLAVPGMLSGFIAAHLFRRRRPTRIN